MTRAVWTFNAALVAMITGDESKATDVREQVKAEQALVAKDVNAVVAHRRIMHAVADGSLQYFDSADPFLPDYTTEAGTEFWGWNFDRASIVSLLPSRSGQGTARGEHEAIKALTARLVDRPAMTRSEAVEVARSLGVSKRGALGRVWPEARRQAGLPPVARPGRKPAN